LVKPQLTPDATNNNEPLPPIPPIPPRQGSAIRQTPSTEQRLALARAAIEREMKTEIERQSRMQQADTSA